MTKPDQRQQPNGTFAVDAFDEPTNRRKMGKLTTREDLLLKIEMAEAICDWPMVERLRRDLARLERSG
jgi:hypothetical protein